jgi:hypothetical protein
LTPSGMSMRTHQLRPGLFPRRRSENHDMRGFRAGLLKPLPLAPTQVQRGAAC